MFFREFVVTNSRMCKHWLLIIHSYFSFPFYLALLIWIWDSSPINKVDIKSYIHICKDYYTVQNTKERLIHCIKWRMKEMRYQFITNINIAISLYHRFNFDPNYLFSIIFNRSHIFSPLRRYLFHLCHYYINWHVDHRLFHFYKYFRMFVIDRRILIL